MRPRKAFLGQAPSWFISVELNLSKVDRISETCLLMAFGRYLGRNRRSMKSPPSPKSPLTPQDAAILTAIWLSDAHPNPVLSQTQIARLIGISKTQLTGRKNSLIERGLCRQLYPADKKDFDGKNARLNFFHLTPDGVDVLEQYAKIEFAFPQRLTQALAAIPSFEPVLDVVRSFAEREVTQKIESIQLAPSVREPNSFAREESTNAALPRIVKKRPPQARSEQS